MSRYGKTIVGEVQFLRDLTHDGRGGPGVPVVGPALYSPNRLRQLVELGALVPTSGLGGGATHVTGRIDDAMIAAARA